MEHLLKHSSKSKSIQTFEIKTGNLNNHTT